MKIKVLLLTIITVLMLPGCADSTPSEDVELIGGQRDEHGCLGPAGYTWDEGVGACIRSWELDDSQKQAAGVVMDYLGYEEGSTIIQVLTARCPGCFTVEVEQGNDRKQVNLSNWEVENTSLTPDECLELGGRTVNTVGGTGCEEGEENIGEVTGFISPNICCK